MAARSFGARPACAARSRAETAEVRARSALAPVAGNARARTNSARARASGSVSALLKIETALLLTIAARGSATFVLPAPSRASASTRSGSAVRHDGDPD